MESLAARNRKLPERVSDSLLLAAPAFHLDGLKRDEVRYIRTHDLRAISVLVSLLSLSERQATPVRLSLRPVPEWKTPGFRPMSPETLASSH